MRVFIAAPDGPGPHPAVLVAHHRGGVDEFTRHVCERIAALGILAAAPNFYHRRPAGEDPVASMEAAATDAWPKMLAFLGSALHAYDAFAASPAGSSHPGAE